MTGFAISYDLSELTLASRRLNEGLERLADPFPLLDEIGSFLVASTQFRFETETGPDGEPWKPTIRGGAILRLSGRLFQSIIHQVIGRQVQAGTNVEYARTHQEGATIRPKKAKALRFRIGSQVIFARKVEVPKRAFLGIDAADRAGILEIAGDHAEESLR